MSTPFKRRQIKNISVISPSCIMKTTHTPSFIGFTTNARKFFSMERFMMFRIICNQFKIFNSIIILNTIYMVNSFYGIKITSDVSLHDESMFADITKVILKRVCGGLNEAVSIFHKLTTLPAFASTSCDRLFLKFSSTRNGASLSSVLRQFPRHYSKRLFANLAYHIRIFHILISYPLTNKTAN